MSADGLKSLGKGNADNGIIVSESLVYRNYREAVDGWDDDTFALYLKYHFSICERADMIGMSHHTLDVLRKESQQ
jgi:hypothetical protein